MWDNNDANVETLDGKDTLPSTVGHTYQNVLQCDHQTGTANTKSIEVYLYTLAVSPSWGAADNTKETTKTMGVSLRSFSNDEGPSRVWMALLEQHSPSSPVFHNLRRFTDAISPTAPTTGLPLQGNPVATGVRGEKNRRKFVGCNQEIQPFRKSISKAQFHIPTAAVNSDTQDSSSEGRVSQSLAKEQHDSKIDLNALDMYWFWNMRDGNTPLYSGFMSIYIKDLLPLQ